MAKDIWRQSRRIFRSGALRVTLPIFLLIICVYFFISMIGFPFLMPQEQEAFEKLQRAKPECDHYDWQQMVPQFGQHLICIRKNPDSIETLYVSILKDSLLKNEKIHSLSTRNFGKVLDLEDFYKFVYRILGSRERQITFWRIFDSVGRQLNTIEELLRTKSFIVYTGGTFMWPGVRKGFRRRTPDGYMMETLSLQPLVFRVENFLTDEECEYVKAESEGVLRFHVAKEEGTYDGLEGVDQPEITWRTSTQAFLPSHDKPKLGVIDDRLASLTKTSVLQSISQATFTQIRRMKPWSTRCAL